MLIVLLNLYFYCLLLFVLYYHHLLFSITVILYLNLHLNIMILYSNLAHHCCLLYLLMFVILLLIILLFIIYVRNLFRYLGLFIVSIGIFNLQVSHCLGFMASISLLLVRLVLRYGCFFICLFL